MNPGRPLIFLNHYIVPGGQCLLWEHIEDAPGKLCTNPRVIIPREMIEGITTSWFRSTCAASACAARRRKDNQQYGIIGMMHILSPALAWLAPRRAARPRQSVDPGFEGHAFGRRRLVLGVLYRQAGRPGQPCCC